MAWRQFREPYHQGPEILGRLSRISSVLSSRPACSRRLLLCFESADNDRKGLYCSKSYPSTPAGVPGHGSEWLGPGAQEPIHRLRSIQGAGHVHGESARARTDLPSSIVPLSRDQHTWQSQLPALEWENSSRSSCEAKKKDRSQARVDSVLTSLFMGDPNVVLHHFLESRTILEICVEGVVGSSTSPCFVVPAGMCEGVVPNA